MTGCEGSAEPITGRPCSAGEIAGTDSQTGNQYLHLFLRLFLQRSHKCPKLHAALHEHEIRSEGGQAPSSQSQKKLNRNASESVIEWVLARAFQYAPASRSPSHEEPSRCLSSHGFGWRSSASFVSSLGR